MSCNDADPYMKYKDPATNVLASQECQNSKATGNCNFKAFFYGEPCMLTTGSKRRLLASTKAISLLISDLSSRVLTIIVTPWMMKMATSIKKADVALVLPRNHGAPVPRISQIQTMCIFAVTPKSFGPPTATAIAAVSKNCQFRSEKEYIAHARLTVTQISNRKSHYRWFW
jgi:hypothetical protein